MNLGETWCGVEIAVNDKAIELFSKHINYSIWKEERT